MQKIFVLSLINISFIYVFIALPIIPEELVEKAKFKEMSLFYNSEELSDATIRCGTEVIPVHRLTLACKYKLIKIVP
jgi:hypothetical protein